MIAGAAGSGKTYIGKRLAKKIAAAYLDKDTISNCSTEKLLVSLGVSPNDRESSLYILDVKDIEYSTLIEVAKENLDVMDRVICSASFIRQILSPEWLYNLASDMKLIDVDLVVVWIKVDVEIAKERILARGRGKDIGKLSNWNRYCASTPHIKIASEYPIQIIDNRKVIQIALDQQIEQLIKEWL